MKKTMSILSFALITGFGSLYAQQDSRTQSSTSTSANPNQGVDAGKTNNTPATTDNTGTSENTRNSTNTRDVDNVQPQTSTGSPNNPGSSNDSKPALDNNRTGTDNRTPNRAGAAVAEIPGAPNANRMDRGRRMMPDLNSWPQASKMAVQEITGKYGKPDGITDEELTWRDKGNWKKICIAKKETKHSFPIEHTDMMQQTISYSVPEDKMDDLGRFDGSVTFDRTQGTMSARCDKEENNLLALNLAHDIITGKKTVEQARAAYGDIVKKKMNGGNPEYMQKLTFSPQQNTADPDKNTTGLSKEDVMKGMKKAE